MDHHYHLLIGTPEADLSAGMQQRNGTYTQQFNQRHVRVGHLFQGRYRAIVREKESHLLKVCHYLVLNPVRAKMVERPEDWSLEQRLPMDAQALGKPRGTGRFLFLIQ
jgi:REP element-mobilizing transposase RayT